MTSRDLLFELEDLEEKKIDIDKRVDATLIFEKINKELEEYLLEKSFDSNSTDGVFDFLEALT